MNESLKIGVSACLLGHNVRYDGGQKLDQNITDKLGHLFTLVPLCPEVECGMTTPREPMGLVGEPSAPRLVTIGSRIDKTRQMLTYCETKVRELDSNGICGFILKARSPSCGFDSAPLNGVDSGTTIHGLFAEALVRKFSLLPFEDEESFSAPEAQKSFMERVLACSSLKDGNRGNIE